MRLILTSLIVGLVLPVTANAAQKSRSTLENSLTTSLPDNTSAEITPAILRGVLTDIVDSGLLSLSDLPANGSLVFASGGMLTAASPGANCSFVNGVFNCPAVTGVSVVNANGFSGSVANASSPPALTLSTTVTGLLKGNGSAISAATAGTDYQSPGSYLTGLMGDLTASGPGNATATLATVNANPGTFGSSTIIPIPTVNAKGLITAITTATIPASVSTGTAGQGVFYASSGTLVSPEPNVTDNGTSWTYAGAAQMTGGASNVNMVRLIGSPTSTAVQIRPGGEANTDLYVSSAGTGGFYIYANNAGTQVARFLSGAISLFKATSIAGGLTVTGGTSSLAATTVSSTLAVTGTSTMTGGAGIGGLQLPVTTQTGAYTATLSDYELRCNAASGAVTITLPAAATAYNSTTKFGTVYAFKKTDTTANACTLQANGSELIDGGNTAVLNNTNRPSITVQSNGTGWDIE